MQSAALLWREGAELQDLLQRFDGDTTYQMIGLYSSHSKNRRAGSRGKGDVHMVQASSAFLRSPAVLRLGREGAVR
jgi:hypothetical protein